MMNKYEIRGEEVAIFLKRKEEAIEKAKELLAAAQAGTL